MIIHSGKRKEWEILEVFSGGTPLTSKKEYYDGKIPFIKSGEVSKNNRIKYFRRRIEKVFY